MITFIAFNFGQAGQYVNGPGICLVNLVEDLKRLQIPVSVFTELPSKHTFSIHDSKKLNDVINRTKILHHWSGIGDKYANIISQFAKAKILIGPNVLDTVAEEKEKLFLSKIKYDKILTLNHHLKFKLCRKYNISVDDINLLLIGPNRKLWFPEEKHNNKILWKGNSKHFVKDVNFAIEVKKRLPRYDFIFLGHPNPYHYMDHIPMARKCKLYFSTSLSETMGMTLLESWASGLPSITHPKIYLHGQNYQTGIIVSREIDSYCQAIQEIMEDENLYQHLRKGAIQFMQDKFSNTAEDYLKKYYE